MIPGDKGATKGLKMGVYDCALKIWPPTIAPYCMQGGARPQKVPEQYVCAISMPSKEKFSINFCLNNGYQFKKHGRGFFHQKS